MTHYPAYPYMELVPPELLNVHIRIDNLPQGKDWRQIRYFLSKFVPRSQIINIKVLPSMPTMTPPFIPIVSCICVLQPSVDWNNLLLQLNGFQWEYHSLGAILLPPPSLPPPSTPSQQLIHQVPHQRSLAFHPQHQKQQQQSRKLKQLFNETAFRKQMTSRSMYQIKFSNFPPCLHWDEIIKYKTSGVAGQHVSRANTKPSLVIKTKKPETYGKLKWTMLKDFIKSTCPELFENTSSFDFYVGVYESDELDVEIQICDGLENPNGGTLESDAQENTEDSNSVDEPAHNGGIEKYMIKATKYDAVVGFVDYNKFLKCLETFQDKEFDLGYKLVLEPLEPLEPN